MRWLTVTVVFSIIWGPWFAYHHVPEPSISEQLIEQARQAPGDALLAELGSYDLYRAPRWKDERQLITAAEKLLLGQIELPKFEVGAVRLPLSAAELASRPTMWQLFVHSLGLPRVLLDAYKADGRADFLAAAAEHLLAYDAFEASGWTPGGYLWNDTWQRFVRNDHAIAARSIVLTEFWRLYRRSPNYRPDVAKAVLRIAARGARLLADPARFTVATNHGVMQNLAACNIQMSFPSLPGVEGLCRLAFRRLELQLAFLINDEGFVLEHSPGYQPYSIVLIGIALRYLTLLEQEVPEVWARKYQAAQRVYAEFRRPDGSLPAFGDTDAGANSSAPLIFELDHLGRAVRPVERVWSPENATLLAPVAGYCLWWDSLAHWPNSRRVRHTAIAWSHFEGMGHKHADEMSLAVWAGGTSWWGNVGYWSYDTPGRETATSWNGANAPHLVGEQFDSQRETRLRYHGREGRLAAIDLERSGPGPYRVRRQVVHIGSDLWIVIDTSSGAAGARTETIWTTAPTVQLKSDRTSGAYTLTDESSGQSLQAFFDGTPGTVHRTIKGNLAPFGGWSVVDGSARPAPAIVVEQPADGSWALAAWSLIEDEAGLAAGPTPILRMHAWSGAEEWEASLPTAAGEATLRRRQGRLDLVSPSGHIDSLELNPGPDVSNERAELRSARALASKIFGSTDISGTYRLKVTAVLLVALLLIALLLRILRGFRPTWTLAVGRFLSAAWLLMSYYFIFVRAQLI